MRLFILALLFVGHFFPGVGCAEAPVYEAAKAERAELKILDHVPILTLRGTPDDIGRQEAALVADKAATLLDFGPSLAKRIAGETAWRGHVIASRALLNNAAPDHRAEILAFQKSSQLPEGELIASQMIYDTLNAFGCSSLLVPGEQSKTGGPLFGRNFDYASLGLLHANDLLKVVRPEGKYAFASISFPGCFGVVSGMNEHGLAIALHEVRRAADDSPRFNAQGVPTLLALRQVLEECRTVAEVKDLLTKLPRTTMYNLAVCDPRGGAVLEVTTKQVILRQVEGINACTNHFRAKELCFDKSCDRFATLMEGDKQMFTVERVFQKLDQVAQGEKTFQSMVFEPKAMILHLAIETRPSTDGVLRSIDLKPLFAR